jgi:KaiC/GvpD/RAD55 family RecA-like ATPase
MNRVPTEIAGFDNVIEGGFPEYSVVMLSGGPGTGKSIFAMEYIYKGALKWDDVGIYVSFEQKPEAIKTQAKQMGFSDFERLEAEGKIILVTIPVSKISKDSIQTIFDKARAIKAKRLVIDSFTSLSINAPVYELAKEMVKKDTFYKTQVITSAIDNDNLKKNFIYQFVSDIRDIPITSIILEEAPSDLGKLSTEGVTEFVVDGVILLKKTTIGEEINRTIHIEKMRMTNLTVAMKEFELCDKGFVVKNSN